MKTIIDLEEELYELKDYLPIIMSNDFFLRMFTNLLVVKEADFYNDAVINLAHFYNYVLHYFLVRLYNCDSKHLELLNYLQLTESCLNSSDGQKIEIKRDEKIDIYTFKNKEKSAINCFFHILGFDKTSTLCKNNQAIFDKRNLSAHLNYQVINADSFEDFICLISKNLIQISEKMYKCTKKLIVNDLLSAIKKKLITEEDYEPFFEQLNIDYKLSINDYKMIIVKDYLRSIKPNTPKYYINKYITEILGLEIN
ncbi:MAG: hypothetical protein PHV37_06630 [Candidatus Gastranaerophilales bacterium]|nr:hypothetical protein [Candidatus Gastranaerophilales bacterium]